MYKRYTLNDLKTVQNNLIPNFFSILKKESCILPLDFFKKVFKDGNSIYYFNRWDATFRVSEDHGLTTIIDEREKIEIVLDEVGRRELQSIIKTYITKKEKVQGQKTIEQILLDEFQKWFYNTILGKPYLVYDIETTSNVSNLKETKFLLGYCMRAKADNTMEYEYIDQWWLKKFIQKMVNFDGYIIGFNHIGFDNPVCIYNTEGTQEDLENINSKSIDLFLFIWALTGKRMGLNKLGTALINVSKTLDVGAQWEILWRKYEETGDLKALEEFKKYCKNDVRMTALVLLYFLHYQKIFMEGEEIWFWINDLIEKGKREIKETNNAQRTGGNNNNWQTSIFA